MEKVKGRHEGEFMSTSAVLRESNALQAILSYMYNGDIPEEPGIEHTTDPLIDLPPEQLDYMYSSKHVLKEKKDV